MECVGVDSQEEEVSRDKRVLMHVWISSRMKRVGGAGAEGKGWKRLKIWIFVCTDLRQLRSLDVYLNHSHLSTRKCAYVCVCAGWDRKRREEAQNMDICLH